MHLFSTRLDLQKVMAAQQVSTAKHAQLASQKHPAPKEDLLDEDRQMAEQPHQTKTDDAELNMMIIYDFIGLNMPQILNVCCLFLHRSKQDTKVRGLDCMKMWPWMRDLPTCLWAGHGWAFDGTSLRRLTTAGGSDAMQGVEVWDSVGRGPEEVKPVQEISKEVACGAAAGGEPGGMAETTSKPSRFQRHNSAKQSGVPNLRWDLNMRAWKVEFYTFDMKGEKHNKTGRVFSLSKFMKQGLSEAEAEAAALEAAKAFRSELVKKGILKEPKTVDPNFSSEVPGVKWEKANKKWRVGLNPTGKKRIYGGYFTEKAAAEAKALELAKEHGLERRVKAVSSFSELPIFKPKVPYPGVKWDQPQQQWRAQCNVNGANRNFRVRPKDHSEEELEAAFQRAVAWKKKQEKENQKTKKAKTGTKK